MAQEHQFWKWGCITLMVLIAAVAAVVWKGLDGMGGIIDHTKDVVIVHTEGGKEVLELSTYEKTVVSTRVFKNTKLWSTKKITYTQSYKAKYGADLEKVTVGGILNIRYKIIVTSIEPIGKATIDSDNGLWNKITDEERAKVEHEARMQARETALQDNAAVHVAEERLVEFIRKKYAEDGQPKVYRRD